MRTTILLLLVAFAVPALAEDESVSLEARLETTQARVLFQDAYIGDILNYIAASYEINVVLDQRAVAPRSPNGEARTPVDPGTDAVRPAAFSQDGRVSGYLEWVDQRDVSLDHLLGVLTRPLYLVYEVHDHHVFVTSPKQQALDRIDGCDAAARGFDEASPALREKLMQRMNIRYEEVALAVALQQTSNHVGIAFVLDPTIPGLKARDANDVLTYIPRYISMQEVPVLEFAEAMVRLCGLELQVYPDFVWISTCDRLDLGTAFEPDSAAPEAK